MRGLGLIGLVIALVVVGLMAKRQLSATTAPPVAVAAPGVAIDPAATPARQVEQIRQSLDDAMKQRPPMPDDAR